MTRQPWPPAQDFDAALDSGGDPALEAFHAEGVRLIETFGMVHRVMATATAATATVSGDTEVGGDADGRQ